MSYMKLQKYVETSHREDRQMLDQLESRIAELSHDFSYLIYGEAKQ